ncbi:tripartite tricarboxylate transporter substrate binding protein [Gelria sp. Kuro-4]|uniref:tripartite tricarboxylate transporter substrate binding protein n=1 Tax=Gelria sp. Kuro-4 TaxID=2796927 RepID=UPI001BF18566|nr:tripartite tricarboxylate transporter substrate binding protein [Gelria sp. Kuro-4]BCV24895.1 recombinase RecA [Gelria sp. Kuro-4]
MVGAKSAKRSVVWILCVCTAVALLSTGCSTSSKHQAPSAPEFPTKPITIMTGYAAGSVTDVGLRLLVPYLEKELGQPITVVNKPGGSGWVAWSELAKAAPDGYTLAVVNVPNFHTGYLNPELKRSNSVRDFDFLANHVSDPSAISVKTDSKFQNVKEIVEYAKANPGKLSVTTTGPATDDHLMALALENSSGAKFNIVHCKGGNESVAQVLGGHIDVLIENVGGVRVPFKNGEIKMLGVATEQRAELVPDVPTLKEQGYNFVSVSARGFAAPKGLPENVKKKLVAALEKAIKNPEHIAKMKEMGLTVQFMGPDEYTQFMFTQEEEVKKLMQW